MEAVSLVLLLIQTMQYTITSVSVFIQCTHIHRLMQSEAREDRCYLSMWLLKWSEIMSWDEIWKQVMVMVYVMWQLVPKSWSGHRNTQYIKQEIALKHHFLSRHLTIANVSSHSTTIHNPHITTQQSKLTTANYKTRLTDTNIQPRVLQCNSDLPPACSGLGAAGGDDDGDDEATFRLTCITTGTRICQIQQHKTKHLVKKTSVRQDCQCLHRETKRQCTNTAQWRYKHILLWAIRDRAVNLFKGSACRGWAVGHPTSRYSQQHPT